MSVFISKVAQITCQQPLCDEWMANPILPDQRLQSAINPDFKTYIAPMQARRMGNILKRAISSAKSTVAEEKRANLDGILTGTGLGCIYNTELFLRAMLKDGEAGLSPSHFMQSTHNTISSQIAIDFQCHNYNITYSHRGTSFDSALFNAILKFETGDFHEALVCGMDEMNEGYFQLLDQIGYWKERPCTLEDFKHPTSEGTFAGETAVSILLTDQKEESICQIAGCELLYRPSDKQLQEIIQQWGEIDAVVLGNNGAISNDQEYERLHQMLCPNASKIYYKHLFGDSYTMSAMGIYVGAKILETNHIPDHLLFGGKQEREPRNLLVINQFQSIDYCLTLLRK